MMSEVVILPCGSFRTPDLCEICETNKNRMVGAVKVRVGKSQVLQRPVDKTALLLENEMVWFPDEGSHTYI